MQESIVTEFARAVQIVIFPALRRDILSFQSANNCQRDLT